MHSVCPESFDIGELSLSNNSFQSLPPLPGHGKGGGVGGGQAQEEEEEKSFYIHVPSPIGLVEWNIQHMPKVFEGAKTIYLGIQCLNGMPLAMAIMACLPSPTDAIYCNIGINAHLGHAKKICSWQEYQSHICIID